MDGKTDYRFEPIMIDDEGSVDVGERVVFRQTPFEPYPGGMTLGREYIVRKTYGSGRASGAVVMDDKSQERKVGLCWFGYPNRDGS